MVHLDETAKRETFGENVFLNYHVKIIDKCTLRLPFMITFMIILKKPPYYPIHDVVLNCYGNELFLDFSEV